MQISILNKLEKTIKEAGILVTKEYVKGMKNVYSHPAIQDYNRTTDSANKTVVTLMKIITVLRDRKENDKPDQLLEILGGPGTRAGNSRTKIISLIARDGKNANFCKGESYEDIKNQY